MDSSERRCPHQAWPGKTENAAVLGENPALPGRCVTAWPWRAWGCTPQWIDRPVGAEGKQKGPHLNAGLSFGMRIGSKPLSDKELGAVVDESLKDGVCPWGSAPTLFKHHRSHASIKLVDVIPMSLTVCPAFGLFFSDKFPGHRQARGHGVSADIKPEFGTRGLNDVQVRPDQLCGWV